MLYWQKHNTEQEGDSPMVDFGEEETDHPGKLEQS